VSEPPERPDPNGVAWLTAARRGDFPSAWAVSDGVLACRLADGHDWTVPRHQQWIWDGRPLCGRVLVRCYHGLGDTLQFARFVPLFENAAVCVWAQPALIPLLRTLPGSRDLLPLRDGAPEVEYDVDIEIMELAHALRITLETLPAAVPYFHVAPSPRHSSNISVGIVAEAGAWNSERSLPATLLPRLLDVENVDFFSLQLAPLNGVPSIGTEDILELASRLRALDIVISVDTMVAHLAGALGVPTWTLLPANADWRWMEYRSDSPWYPTMRLFRQPAPRQWEPVIQDVCAQLARLTA